MYDEAEATVERATNRVGLLTALETKSLPHLSTSEAFQIVNYGIGGMYHPHHDFLVSHIFGWVLEIFCPIMGTHVFPIYCLTGFKFIYQKGYILRLLCQK